MDIDCVIIGLNSAATLGACLEHIRKANYTRGAVRIFYVDGGSTDQSVELARTVPGVETLTVTPEWPAPGIQRNAGWRAGHAPLVQFFDSDTEMHPDWFEQAVSALTPDVVAVSGRLQEKHPEASWYNWIGNLEWNAPAGEAQSFSGCVLLRRSALEATGGYNEEMVGGEDPELSQRVRKAGGRILQLAEPMARHDLGMTRFKQYWRRSFRTGYGFAAVVARHGGAGFWRQELRRIALRGGAGPGLIVLGLLGALVGYPLFLGLCLPGLLLLFYPLIFSVSKFMEQKQLNRDDARRYAWHCVLVVTPEFLGLMRYIWGALTGHPLRNSRRRLGTRATVAVGCLLALLLGAACSSVKPDESVKKAEAPTVFTTEPKEQKERFASSAELAAAAELIPDEYRMGPGDRLDFAVWNRPELNKEGLVISPDGNISILRIGQVNAKGRTVSNVVAEISLRLSKYYDNPQVTLMIKEYANNKAFVLGRVSKPGVVNFPGDGTLLEALAMAGGLPVLEKDTFLTKCAIIRGKDKVIWIDLRELLYHGNVTLNARIQNNDIIFIPESKDELVYVMGEVKAPGAQLLKSQLTYLDALMLGGGPTPDANLKETYVMRYEDGKPLVHRINLQKMLETGDKSENYMLKDNDIVYVCQKGVVGFNYNVSQALPSLQVLTLGTASLEKFGVMAEFRRKFWGLKGFVSGN